MSFLLSPLTLRATTFRNRAWVSPMCMYSSEAGMPTDWHLMHLGARAAGGAGLVFTEATAVTAVGRISPHDAGLWNDAQAAAYERIAGFVAGQGAVPGIQLAHAGRKGSTLPPWRGRGYVEPEDGGWQTVGASPLAYGDWPTPKELSLQEIDGVVQAFAAAAIRADGAGFEVAEIHAAHGYLLHQFLSPLSNQRADAYGGGFLGRIRIVIGVVDAVRSVWPARKPLFVRLSASDWADGGWAVDETVELARLLADHGVDLVDVSSGGLTERQQVIAAPGYQVPFARAVREGSGLPVGAVGLITEPAQAERVLREHAADAVLIARASIREPNWPLRAAHELGNPSGTTHWPSQYARGAYR